jgi:hypothetical protein
MREYKVEVILRLDDEGYLEKKCWILDAIADQLQDDEEIIKYRVTTIKEKV